MSEKLKPESVQPLVAKFIEKPKPPRPIQIILSNIIPAALVDLKPSTKRIK